MDTMDYPVEECLDRIRDKAKAPPAPFFSFTSIPIGTDEEYIAYLERRIKTLSVLLVERTLEKIQWEDGNEYPLVKVEISNTSHPFYTGKSMFVDTAGRIEKFKKRYEKKA